MRIIKNQHFYQSLKGILITFLVVAGLISVTSIAYATLYNINTNDTSVAEWESQGIGVYQTDDTGETGVDPHDDIVNTWIASGPSTGPADHLYFRMETGGDPGLNTNVGAIAALDCNDNGVFDDFDDRLIVRIRDCWDGTTNHEERNAIAMGDQSSWSALGPDAGQTVNNYQEWGVPIDSLPPDDQTSIDCRGQVDILFYTADVTGMCRFPPSQSVVIDQTTAGNPWTGWNIPSAVEMQAYEANSISTYGILGTVTGIVALISGVGLVLLVWWRRKLMA